MSSEVTRPRLVITGSEGLIGRELVRHFSGAHEVLRLDISLGHDLNDQDFVVQWFRDFERRFVDRRV